LGTIAESAQNYKLRRTVFVGAMLVFCDHVCYLTELRIDSSTVIRSATAVCPDLAVQLIMQSIGEQMQQAEPQQPSQTSNYFDTMGHKKCATLLLFISSPVIDRFSKFFHWHTLQTICNNVIIIYPTTW